MSVNYSTPWHRRSYDRFVHERLPQLLAERLPLAGYEAEPTGRYTSRVRVAVAARAGEVWCEYDLPQPDEEGVFDLAGRPHVVIPLAAHEDLERADIRCAGERLYELIAARLGEGSPDLPWDEPLLRAWLPLDSWAAEFLAQEAQPLDQTNWLARHTHLRRLVIQERRKVIAAGQFGRTCPFETPEGPNIGRVLTIAVGAEVRDGRLVVVDDRPEAALGLSASMIPFLEHSDPNRLLMGANMLRQWLVPPEPEPALVQSGNEPDAPAVWCGRNLLTAFISSGGDTVEDGIVISEAAARRLGCPYPAEPGDKLANRHGTKGVVSRVLPEEEMPHLADGKPIELVYSFIGLHSRLNFGQEREAVMGRIARAEGSPAVVPPFQAPGEAELKERLARAGLPESGLEPLTLGRGGEALERPALVGWVYWGCTAHVARDKLQASVRGVEGAQEQGELEYYALRRAGSTETIRETYNTRSAARPDAGTLAARVAAGVVAQAGAPGPLFQEVQRRLAAAGIRALLEEERLSFRLAPPAGSSLKLARPLPHPWLREHELVEIGGLPGLPEYAPLAEANGRLERMLAGGAPATLVARAAAQLEGQVRALFAVLLTPEHLRFDSRVLFSGRSVLAPGPDLRVDQVGLPEEMAWTLFGPLVARELGDEEPVRARDEAATRALDGLLARSWVIVNRAPTVVPRAFLAFHPLRWAGRAIRLHPLACGPLDADFDGDQAAVFLPVTEAGQREAGERLTIAAHLARDPGLLDSLAPTHEAMWGLAWLSLAESGRRELAAMLGTELPPGTRPLTRPEVVAAVSAVLEQHGAGRALELLERLLQCGLAVARASGASITPFPGATPARTPEPEGEDPAQWEAYVEQVAEQLASRQDYRSQDLGPQLLASASGARSRARQLAWLVGPQGIVYDAAGRPTLVRHGLSRGLTAAEMYATVARARTALAALHPELERMGYEVIERSRPQGLSVLARAMRAQHPGIVFARAAASGEVDPLTDVDSRLFVGL